MNGEKSSPTEGSQVALCGAPHKAKDGLFVGSVFNGVAQKSELLNAANVHAVVGVPVPVFGTTFRAAYARADGQGNLEAADAEQHSLGFIYDLSKRTALYATASLINNKGTANFTVGDITVASPNNTATPLAPLALLEGAMFRGLETGIRHIF